ncbi:hypothetical protein M0R45_014392 [Rubus argutus]|uniref:Glutathione S-transferase n=1 Tax=Rubus argutus TaxID=59490 RepID=A0AAW1XM48_RUBAR
MGERSGFLDIALITFYSWFHACATLGNFCIEAEFPKLNSWAKTFMQEESVFKSLADQKKVYEFILEIRKKMGGKPSKIRMIKYLQLIITRNHMCSRTKFRIRN